MSDLVPASAGARVSVIIPVFNGASHLADAVESVVIQTLAPHEIIFVDDGSTDSSAAILAALQGAHGENLPITILTQSNGGQSASRNLAVGVATGDLLAFLDQDDLWHADHLLRLSEPFALQATLGLVYGDFDEIDIDGRLVTRHFIATHGLAHPKLSAVAWIKEDTMILPTASLVRTSAFRAVGGFDPQLQGYEDDDLWFRLFRAGWESEYVPDSLARFRVHGLSSSRGASFRQSRMRFFRKVAAELPDDDRLQRYYVSDVLVPRLVRSNLGDYRAALATGEWSEARDIARAINQLFDGSRSGFLRGYKRRLLRFPRLTRFAMSLRRASSGGVDPRQRLR
jgi:glycosyltransferase involved in cell wall biosynthesis